MRLNFRQGIVRHQTDSFGVPIFLNVSGGFVSLVVAPDPTIVTFIHGNKDYLYTERLSVSQAWGPFTVGTDAWLYWQLNRVTGAREFGSTLLEPIESALMPPSPLTGQTWFNTVANLMYEWNGAAWVEVIRVFACRLELGQTPRSVSINAPAFTGTQVGLTVKSRSGGLSFDDYGQPIRTGDGKFFTTEDSFVTGVPTGASLRVSNIVIPGVAQEPLAAYSVVEYTDFNQLVHADPIKQGSVLYGFIEEDAATGEMVNFVTEGLIVNTDWDWIDAGADVNDPVYNDGTGAISLTPGTPGQLPVGVVVGQTEILFAPRIFPQVVVPVVVPQAFTDLSDTPTDYTGAAGWAVRVNSTEDGLIYSAINHNPEWGNITGTLASQTDLDTELQGKAPIVHSHVIADVTNLQTELDSAAQDMGEYTVATLPDATQNANKWAVATDAVGGRTVVRSDGAEWKIIAVEGATVV